MASEPEPLTTYLELRESNAAGEVSAGLSHKAGGMFLLHVLELAAFGEPRGGVTVLHDAGSHGARHVALARALARERWAVALPDLRGHGRSEGPRGHCSGVGEVLRDIDEIQQHLAYRLPIAPKVLIGHGLGALYALAFALERPGRLAGLVLCAPLWSPRFAPVAKGGWLKALRKSQPTDAGKLGYLPEQLVRDPAALAALRSDQLMHDVITLRAGQLAEELAQQCAPRLSQVDCPVLILHGTADKISEVGQSRSKAGGKVEVRAFEGALHDVLVDAPDECIDALRGWLAQRAE